MDEKTYNEIQKNFIGYLSEKKLRKTEERTTILEQICTFPAYFDINMLHEKLTKTKFHVSKATLYNTIEILIGAGIVIRHQANSNAVYYELRILAESNMHAICMKCGAFFQVKNHPFQRINGFKITRFSPEFFLFYSYGLCSKCKYKEQRMRKNVKKY